MDLLKNNSINYCILIHAYACLNQFTGKLKIFSPLVRMPVLSHRRVSEIRKGTGESGNRNWNSFAGSTSERSTRHYVGRQGIYLNFLLYINFPFISICIECNGMRRWYKFYRRRTPAFSLTRKRTRRTSPLSWHNHWRIWWTRNLRETC